MSEKREIGRIIADRYEIFDIKKGGMGLVFICYNKVDREMIVLKTFHDRFLSDNRVVNRFMQEATTWIHLDHHRNIVRAYSVADIYFRPHIFLEYVASDFHFGLDLSDYMACGLLPLETVFDFAGQFCVGMIHAQEKMENLGKQFVHADIKPSNILIKNRSIVKITDFGLSRAFDDETSGGWGTLAYMSPEQFTKTPLDVRSDIYSFGCVLYEMACGTKPFMIDENGDRPLLRMLYREKHFQEVPMAPGERRRDCPAGLNDLIMQCLEKNPEKRISDFHMLKEKLADIHSKMTGRTIGNSTGLKELPDTRKLVDKAISLIQLGRYQDAIACLDGILSDSRDPELNWIAYGSRGSALAAMGLTDKALDDFNAAIRLFPDRPLSYNSRANLYNNAGELQKALADYDKAIELDNNYAIGFYNRGICHRRFERFEKALADFSRAIELGHYESYTNRGSTYLNLEKYEEALSDFIKALEFYPRNSIALMNIGVISEERGQDQEAIEYYTRAIQITPSYLVPYFKRAYLFAEQGRYPEAITDYEKALSIDPSQLPKDASVDYSLSKIELDRIYPLIFHDCGLSYMKTGDYLKGKEYLQRFLETASPFHTDRIAQVKQVIAWADQKSGIR